MSNIKNVIRIISISKPPFIIFILLVFLQFLYNILVGIKSLLYLFLIDEVIMKGNYDIFIETLIIFLSTTIAHLICGFYYSYLLEIFRNKIRFNLFSAIYAHIVRLPFSYFKNNPSSYLAGRIVTDVETLDNSLFGNIFSFSGSVLSALTACFLGFIINWRLLGILVFLMPFYFLIVMIFSSKIKKSSERVQENKALFIQSLQENFSGIYDIKINKYEHNSFLNVLNSIKSYIFSILNFNIFSILYSTSSSGLLSLFITTIFYGIGGFYILKGLFSVGGLFAFSIITPHIIGPVSNLANINVYLQTVIVSIKRITDFFEENKEDFKRGEKIEHIDKIQYKNIQFFYNNKEILSNINFQIKKGEIVAFVGRTGEGKTTIINLLLKLYKPSKGKIYINGKDVDEINTHSLRSIISLAPQSTFIFNSSLYENIKVGNPDASYKEINDVINIVCLEELVSKEETIISEKGANLSGGEIGRIGIARAVLRNPDVLIIDEALSQIDSITETKIIQNIRRMFKDKIIIIIAHRLSTIKDCDKIFLLKDGKIIAKGKHSILLKTSKDYRNLYNEQMIMNA